MLNKPDKLFSNVYRVEWLGTYQTPLAILDLKLSGVSCVSSTSTGAAIADENKSSDNGKWKSSQKVLIIL